MAEDYLPDHWQRIDSSPYARVAINRERQLCYKEFLPRSPAESIMALVRGSRATRARLNSEALLQLGIDAPANILWGKLPGGCEYLFTELAPGEHLGYWLNNILVSRRGEQLQLHRQLLTALGIFIGRVHTSGFIHGDLRPGNVFAALQHGRFRFTLIDNERNIRRRPPPGTLLLRNLMELNMLPPAVLSRTDRMRFFCAWRRQMRDLSPVEGKLLAGQAYQQAMQRLLEKNHG